jgi:hypothetical protein
VSSTPSYAVCSGRAKPYHPVLMALRVVASIYISGVSVDRKRSRKRSRCVISPACMAAGGRITVAAMRGVDNTGCGWADQRVSHSCHSGSAVVDRA